MKCPNCNETLLMTHRNNIEIDYCPSCRGIWLDKGELDKLLEQESRAGESNERPDDRGKYDQPRYDAVSYTHLTLPTTERV